MGVKTQGNLKDSSSKFSFGKDGQSFSNWQRSGRKGAAERAGTCGQLSDGVPEVVERVPGSPWQRARQITPKHINNNRYLWLYYLSFYFPIALFARLLSVLRAREGVRFSLVKGGAGGGGLENGSSFTVSA
ncbi:hypothetical protein ZHAS_00018953 [Anopheles sinensis]|uniref:Uncharacterized protein n=1 Tax=Anopheles sinensis TaxID=74873 RepID=A0A084WK85_ANOSI|nr:hypothetical protein ZHAS_00018953 [Anopheles sinensis]